MFEDAVQYSANTEGRLNDVGNVLFFHHSFSLLTKTDMICVEHELFTLNRNSYLVVTCKFLCKTLSVFWTQLLEISSDDLLIFLKLFAAYLLVELAYSLSNRDWSFELTSCHELNFSLLHVLS